jgi:hypothetical protein
VTRATTLAWIALAVWIVVFHALRAFALSATPFGVLVPDLAAVLVIALAGRLAEGELYVLALCAALGRVGLSVEPPVAVLTGYLGLVGLAFVARHFVDVNGMGVRAVLAGFGVLALDAWLLFVDEVRVDLRASVVPAARFLWPAAIASAACAFVVAPALLRLPGLGSLRRRRW